MEPEKDKPSTSGQDSLKSFISSKFSSMEPESHLESLGLTLNNGKARFKLDEDAPLYTSQAVSHFTGTEDEDDTLSFVVLGKSSMETIQQLSLASYIDIKEKCMSTDYNSMISSLDATETNQKLNELLQENAKLKEALKQNNVAMKQQFNTLAKLQEEIMQVHQNHKRKFSETRELINYLKRENQELKMKLSMDLGYEILDASGGEKNKKELTPKLAPPSCSDLETVLNEAINATNNGKTLEQCSTSSHGQSQSSISNEMLGQASTSKETLIQSFSKINEMLRKSSTSMEKPVPVDNIGTKLDKINVYLKNTIERTAESEGRGTSGTDLLEGVSLDLEKIREVIEEEKKQLETRKQNLQVEYDYLHSAKELLEQQKLSLQQEQTSLDQQSQLYEMHYKNALDDGKRISEKCEEMTKEIRVLHETIERKEARIQSLENEVSQQKEKIGLLETQLKIYEDDFKQERVMKEQLLNERENLQRDLQQQIDFSEELQRRINTMFPEEARITLKPPQSSNLTCPVCNVVFGDLATLEDHIIVCLDS